jgi:GntR family transcriptional regulator
LTPPRRAYPYSQPTAHAAMFHVDPSDPTPLEVQLVRSIRSSVGAGLLTEGEPLPTVRQLAVELRVNANDVARAYAELERQGIVQTRAGVGTVVRASREAVGREELLGELRALEDTFLRGAAALGFSLDDVIIHLDSRRRGREDDPWE